MRLRKTGLSGVADKNIALPPLQRTIGERIRDQRSQLGWSQGKLARKSHVDRTQISEIERGTCNVKVETLYALALNLGVTMSDLLVGLEIELGDAE